MEVLNLFERALGLENPWYVVNVELIEQANGKPHLHIWIDFKRGARFTMEDGKDYPVYSTYDRQWRHLDFFDYECYLHTRAPRVRMPDGSTINAELPWARPGSSFTLLFEAFALKLVKHEMNLSQVGKLLNVDSRVIGRILDFYVKCGLKGTPIEDVKTIGIDETSVKKGHNYITVVSDLENKKVLAVAVGKDVTAAEQAFSIAKERGFNEKKVQYICMDLSPAYIAFAGKAIPQADIVFDRFHLEKLLNVAMDDLRRKEQYSASLLKKSRYLWLKHPSILTEHQQDKIHYLSTLYPTIGKAYRLKLLFKYIWDNHIGNEAVEALLQWIKMAQKAYNSPFQKFVNTLKAHWTGIVNFFYKRITNAYSERVNLKIQEAKRRAKGYRNIENFANMIYFLCADLNIPYLQKSA